MPRKQQAAQQEEPILPEGFTWGRDISLEHLGYNKILTTPEGSAIAYLGYFDYDRSLDTCISPLGYAHRIGADTQNYKFVRLRRGNLIFDSFLSPNSAYKIRDDLFLMLPNGPDNYFGVMSRDSRETDEDLTRKLFGATFQDLDGFLPAFFAAMRYPVAERYYQPFGITFSKSRDNGCDIGNYLIPRNFPFLKFGDTNYYGGHVSLYGFYSQIAFLCEFSRYGNEFRGQGFFKQLLEYGAGLNMIIQLKDAYFEGQGSSIMDPRDFYWIK